MGHEFKAHLIIVGTMLSLLLTFGLMTGMLLYAKGKVLKNNYNKCMSVGFTEKECFNKYY